MDENEEEGIEADDEDNDQIETERAINPTDKRNKELQKILQQNNNASNSKLKQPQNIAQARSSNGFTKNVQNNLQNVVPNSQNISLNQNELYQIKESYEGKNGGLISSGGE